MAKEYIIYCDESVSKGRFFSNFYGGVLVTSDRIDAVRDRIGAAKQRLHLGREVKWQKVGEAYLPKYIELMDTFFDLIAAGDVKVRIMFTQNMFAAKNLTNEHKEQGFFILYYHFIKHAFGFLHHPAGRQTTRIRLLLDQLPDTKEKAERFRGFLCGLSSNPEFRAAKLVIERENISDVSSHDHPVLQCLDVVLGAMQFRLNDLHKEKAPGKRRRGKRTRAKEALYNHINKRIRAIYPHFNIGVSTGTNGSLENRWLHPYRHWCFLPSEFEIVGASKKKKSERPR